MTFIFVFGKLPAYIHRTICTSQITFNVQLNAKEFLHEIINIKNLIRNKIYAHNDPQKTNRHTHMI